MEPISQDDSTQKVEYVEKLSRLEISEQQKLDAAKYFTDFLKMADELSKYDNLQVKIVRESGSADDLRKDEIRPSLSQAEALANAPESENGYFVVPCKFYD